MNNKSRKENRTVLQFIAQILIAILIMLFFGTYVWLIQLQFDMVSKDPNGHWFVTAAFYAAIVAAGGFSYDCAKGVLYLKKDAFKRFIGQIGSAVVDCILVVVLMGASFYLLNRPEAGSHLFGQIFYLAGIVTTWFLVNNASAALETAAGDAPG